MSSLLPPNASAAERAFEAAAARLADVPTPQRDLWHPDHCPMPLLPWLAWAVSVDAWDPDWPEARKRASVAAAIAIHRRKGTPAAVLAALDTLGLPCRLLEWFDHAAPPYTFGVEVDVPGALPATLYQDVTTQATAAKNTRSHLTLVRVRTQRTGGFHVAAAQVAVETITVYPAPHHD